MEELKKITFLPTEQYVRPLGRTIMLDDCRLLSLSGSGVEFKYVGDGLTINFYGDSSTEKADDELQPWKDQARMAVFVDGNIAMDVQITKRVQKLEVCEHLPENQAAEHTVRIIKLSEPRMSSVGLGSIEIMATGEAVPTVRPAKRVEIIGDSITCGYGIDTPNENCHFSTGSENVTKAYSYLTAEKLGLDYSLVSYSGHGIISGYTPDPDKPKTEELLPPYYDILSYSYNSFRGKAPQSYDYDFSFRPDLVIINLGTNDESYISGNTDKLKKYEDEMLNFVLHVHDKNPEAAIVLAYGVMGDFAYSAQLKVTERFKSETGYDRIFNFHMEPQNAELNGYCADYHPSWKTHVIFSEKLSDFLKTIDF